MFGDLRSKLAGNMNIYILFKAVVPQVEEERAEVEVAGDISQTHPHSEFSCCTAGLRKFLSARLASNLNIRLVKVL